MVTDEQLLAGLRRCRELGALAQVHAENGDAVAEGQRAVFAAGVTGPEGHALSRPAALEGEATARAIRLAEFAGAPLYVVHVMSADAMEEIGRARWAAANACRASSPPCKRCDAGRTPCFIMLNTLAFCWDALCMDAAPPPKNKQATTSPPSPPPRPPMLDPSLQPARRARGG
jgi:hypothetical protein